MLDALLMAAPAADSLETLYRRHARAVWAYARARAPRPDLAEDLAAEAFLALGRRLREEGPPDDPLGYLLTCVRSRAIDETRRRKPGPLPAQHPADRADRPVEDRERRERCFAAVRALDVPLAEAVALKLFAELTFEEAARIAGVPRGTLESRYALAIERLSFLLHEEKP